ncbi:MAG: DUF456 domain-containing protein [Oligoflexia bacterium]|nr:DUF456 domain-containing protein [Oligoflexia bacterium]
MTYVIWTFAILLVILGLLGTVLPVLPGAPALFAGLVMGAYADNFNRVGGVTLALLSVLCIAALLIDFYTVARGAKRTGASKLAVVGASLGMVLGIFGGVIGIFIFPFFGALLGEFIVRRDLLQAGRAGIGTWLGLVLGVALKLTLMCLMLSLFMLDYFVG